MARLASRCRAPPARKTPTQADWLLQSNAPDSLCRENAAIPCGASPSVFLARSLVFWARDLAGNPQDQNPHLLTQADTLPCWSISYGKEKNPPIVLQRGGDAGPGWEAAYSQSSRSRGGGHHHPLYRLGGRLHVKGPTVLAKEYRFQRCAYVMTKPRGTWQTVAMFEGTTLYQARGIIQAESR